MENIDIKTIIAIVGVLGTLITIVQKFLPNEIDHLKKLVELLKMSKETEVNYLPLKRKVDIQIHNLFIEDKNKYVGKFFDTVIIVTIMMFVLFGIIGLLSVTIGSFIFDISEEKSEFIISIFAIIGLLIGFFGGISVANDKVKDLKSEAKKIKEQIIKDDKEILRKQGKKDEEGKKIIS